jgi:sigma-B regulation protein RsbU (phosphoserine phosphatase)
MDDGAYYMAGAPIGTLGWTLIYVFDQAMADKPAEMLVSSYQEIQDGAGVTYLSRMRSIRRTMTLLLLLVAALALISAIILGKKIVRTLNLITKRIANLSESNLEFTMEDEYRTDDEIQVLAESFAKLSHRTVEYVGEVRRVTAEKERIGTELHMANQIQESMLPSIFPAFPERREFDIYALMDPAREVGGDFYDFFLIDKDHLCMVIADVSGKGIPAALFMMISKIIIQSCAMLGRDAGEILTKTNEALCSNNRMEMFVTVWIGILEISTGKLTAANAGHEYPAIKTGDKFELLKDKHGLVIGAMPGIVYKEYELDLKPGDKLFLYTDGVAEATRGGDELFGTKRMLNALNRNPDADPVILLRNVRRAVDEFVGSDEQFDDLTMLAFEYKGPEA